MKSLSHVRLLATPWTAAHQAPPSMGFSRQVYWSGLPLPSPGSRMEKCNCRYEKKEGGCCSEQMQPSHRLLCQRRAQRIAALACYEGGDSGRQTSKGHRADICTCPERGSEVLTHLSDLKLEVVTADSKFLKNNSGKHLIAPVM